MRAIIRAFPGLKTPSLFDVAGRPLIVRQLQWLRDAGIDRVVVSTSSEQELKSLQGAVADDAALARNVRWIVAPGDDRALLRELIGPGVPTFVLDADLIGGADLVAIMARCSRSSRVTLQSPGDWAHALRLRPTVDVIVDDAELLHEVTHAGWGVRIRSAADGLLLASAVLARRTPPLGAANVSQITVHAAERAPGVWIARGAHVEDGARLVSPVYVGAEAYVCCGAQVGPATVLQRRAGVERTASVAGSTVEEGVIVGEGVTLRAKQAARGAVYDLHSGRRLTVADRLLLDARRPRRNSWSLPFLRPRRATSRAEAASTLARVRREC
jgi:carbonic anhydrase/acetyltransferase-like protein (isoleucine patch superfamily)